MDTMDEIRQQPVRLARSQRKRAAEVLCRAFQNEPWAEYLSPDWRLRPRLLSLIFNAQLNYCFLYGEIYTTSALHGVSCWLYSPYAHFTHWQRLYSGMTLMSHRLGREARRRYADLVIPTGVLRHRIMQRPYWYLLALGVEPTCQRQGIGGQLTWPMLARADAEKLPCFLETQSERNVSYYQKYGFAVAGTGATPIPFWSMVREPCP